MIRTAWKPVAIALAVIAAVVFTKHCGVGLLSDRWTAPASVFDGKVFADQVLAEEASAEPSTEDTTPLLVFAQSIMFGEETLSAWHIDQLRSLGPSALDKLLALRKVVIDGGVRNGVSSTVQLSRLDRLIDEVGAQRNCTYSRLYWYTDWQQAVEASKNTGQPILSLHMMGKLTDALSCADSRIFRLALYANESVANELRTQFVLHWHSVRPLPRVTIDFGDGRQIQTTLAGNSVHYVINSEGNVLDGIPGRCSPQHFLAWLQRMGDLHGASRTWSADEFAAKLAAFHQSRISTVNDGWARAQNRRPGAGANRASVISSTGLPQFTGVAAIARSATTDIQSVRPAVANLDEVRLDANCLSLLREFEPLYGIIEPDEDAKELEMAFQAAVTALERSLAVDSAVNEYHLHRKLHEWFVGQKGVVQRFGVNDWVYSNLFQTPLDDRWYGLLRDSTSSGLARNGILVDETPVPNILTGSFDDRLKNLSDAIFQESN